MHRILAILLVCLLPLQSFASGAMGMKMVSEATMNQMQLTGSVQAPCHQASQSMQAPDQDCCGSQATCQSLCQMATMLPPAQRLFGTFALPFSPPRFTLLFQSADLRAGFKPPIL